MVDNLHPERLGLLLQVAAYPAHAQDTEDLVLWIVAEAGEWATAPLAFAESVHAGVEIAQGADD